MDTSTIATLLLELSTKEPTELIEEELPLPIEHALYTQTITEYYRKVSIRTYQLFKTYGVESIYRTRNLN
ncbi:26113_t:CDS:2 [Gigaspora margarita]|uniref:26113_t:CDS:1 n=1 Tax=Gigaspora margarita TaxID=4874 RepID=A0ABN7VL66_GIGMA|nr:26113_t:CDS:2 [Gigaspora margarita]